MKGVDLMSARVHDPQVLIVGAGPCGLTLANYLGTYGVKTLLLEREQVLPSLPRAVGLDDESLRSFQAIGLAEEIIRSVIQNVPLRLFDSKRRCFADIRPSTREFGWFRRNVFMQPIAEECLRHGLDRFPDVEFLPGHEVVALEDHGDSVTVSAKTLAGDDVQFTAQFVVGADGGRSSVRHMLDVSLSGETHADKWLVFDAESDPLDAPFTGLYCHPWRPYVSAQLPFGMRRWEFILRPGDSEEEFLTLAKMRELLRPTVPDADSVNIVRSRIYTHHSRMAERFVKGRVCLIGDAAHLMPPWAGQGMNTGIRDATNVAWKLAFMVQGRADASLIETYDSERRGHAKDMIELSNTLGKLLLPKRRWVSRTRDVFFQSVGRVPSIKQWILDMRFKPMPYYKDGIVVHSEAKTSLAGRVGRMFIQPTVETTEGKLEKFDDLLGPGFSVIGFEHDPLDFLTHEQLKKLDLLRATTVKVEKSRRSAAEIAQRSQGPTQVVEDAEGQLWAWFGEGPERFVIVRPDRYIAAVTTPGKLGAQIDELNDLLDGTA